MSDLSRRKKFITNVLYIAVIVGIVYLVFKYLLGLLWPFLLAFLFAWLLKPLIRALTVRCHLRYGLSTAIALLLFFAVVGSIVAFLVFQAVSGLGSLLSRVPALYTDTIEPGLTHAMTWLEGLAERMSPDAQTTVDPLLEDFLASFGSAITDLSLRLVTSLSGWVTKLPGHLLGLVICIISTVFMCADWPRISAFLWRQIPERYKDLAAHTKGSFQDILLRYGKSYGLIMLITFLEIFVGLLLIRQRKAWLIAALVAVFDIFPVVGAGLILLPWGLICLLNGSPAKGTGILALWVVVIVVRQIIEPRIVGKQVGLHPLITLAAMFLGARLFGAVGLLGLPITCAILQSLDSAGVIHILVRDRDEDRQEGKAGPGATVERRYDRRKTGPGKEEKKEKIPKQAIDKWVNK